MKIENGILKEVTNDDLSNGAFVMPDFEVEEVDPHAFDKCTELQIIICAEGDVPEMPFLDDSNKWTWYPFEGIGICPKK